MFMDNLITTSGINTKKLFPVSAIPALTTRPTRTRRNRVTILALLFCVFTPVNAHEYWLETTSPSPHNNLSIEFIARVGEGLQSKHQQAFSDRSHERLWIDGDKALPSEVRISSNRSKLVIQRKNSNTTSVAYQERPALHRYKNFDEFTQYAKEEGVEYVVEQHLNWDLPKSHFFEQFTRHTKTLFCSAPESEIDSNTPIDYEWIAKDNVYNPDSEIVQLQLMKADKPLTSKAVTVFAQYKGGEEVKRIRLETDNQGMVSITNKPGRYLINSTVVHRANRDVTLNTGAVWESHWVSLTFNNQC